MKNMRTTTDITRSYLGTGDQSAVGVALHKEPTPAAIASMQRNVDYWGERCCKAEAQRDRMIAALHTIVANTEADAIPHFDYAHLAKDLCECAEAALEGVSMAERHRLALTAAVDLPRPDVSKQPF